VDPNVFETANAGFAQALYEEFLRNPASVDEAWRELFESGIVGERPTATGPASPPSPAVTAPPPGVASAHVGPPGGEEIKGPAARLAANMDASLTVPTATTFRQIPVSILERRRAQLNQALAASGRELKVSFTHLIAFGLVEAVTAHPSMAHAFQRTEGTPYRITPTGVHLGLAVDLERKDGSRGLVVPVLRDCGVMEFATFHALYEAMVQKARTHKLMPDDFVGATITLTNPGGLGTSASVPRLMVSQGTIVAVGSIGFPPAFSALAPERLAELQVTKVMTLTSTYDHRVIQGAESGEFLRTIEDRLQGGNTFYERIAASLGLELGEVPKTLPPRATPSGPPPSTGDPALVAAGMSLVDTIRTHGHLAATLDPLGSAPIGDPALDPEPHGLTEETMREISTEILNVWVPGKTLAEALPHLQSTYSGTLAYEVEHVSNHEERSWLREIIESGGHRRTLPADDKRTLLRRLTVVEAFERFLQTTYLGQKRFSIEGLDALTPMLDLAIETATLGGTREVVLGMAHRGRLNVLAHTLGRPYVTIFAEFEGSPASTDDTVADFPGTGDVKYHLGAEGSYSTRSGTAVAVSLVNNPSHVEFVGPIVDGRARARQTQRRAREPHHDWSIALPIVIHGDAAFAAQGVVAETLNLGALEGYSTGGTVHVIANNQIGFTTDMRDARSTTYSSDLAKGFDVPIIHVNADDAEACLDAMRLAMKYRERFHQDVVIDLVGYRRHGHNEGDEPAYTQPMMAARIASHPTVRQLYASQLAAQGVLSDADAESLYSQAYDHLVHEHQGLRASLAAPRPPEPLPRRIATGFHLVTGVSGDVLTALNDQLLSWPERFHPHPKLSRQFERRRTAVSSGRGIDWAHAEALAIASLLTEGVPVRFTGQDTERGTFSQRHLVLHDVENGEIWAPIRNLPGAQASLELHNSPLSELAALGFEYGYSAAAPETLVIWEAQFGDFVNSAQVIVDQFLAAGLAKWGVTTRLTLLLPHGYEGQGPEHSSARIERFLQLAAEGAIRVANCTTPAQYFHLLRRQALRNRIRPLVIFTPKSLLRHPRATSSLDALISGRFEFVIDDAWARERPEIIERLVLCSGKVYYDLIARAESMTERRPAVVRLEKLYSFPQEQLEQLFQSYPNLREVVWTQEEPQNMGVWDYIDDLLRSILPRDVVLLYAGRPPRASPAEGYPAAHAAAQTRLVAESLGTAETPEG
jgi:2-oxoglutarate dehydrogenase E1 component